MKGITKSVLIGYLIAFLSLLSFPTLSHGKDKKTWPTRLVGHGGPIRSISLSKDNRYALTASFDYSIIYWALEGNDGRVLKRLIGHDAAVNDVAFVHGEKKAVSVGDDGKFIIWNLESGKIIKQFQHKSDKAISVDVSKDGKLAASARWDQTVRIYNLENNSQLYILKQHKGSVNDVKFSDDGELLYSASYDGIIREWDMKSGNLLRPVYSHGWGINTILMLSDSSHMVFGAVDGSLGVIKASNGELVAKFNKLDRPILSLSKSHDEKLFSASAGDGSIHIYQYKTWRQLEVQHNPTGPVWGLALTAKGERAYYTGLDDYAIGWQVTPRLPYETVKGKFIRRFQSANIKDPGERQFRRKCSICHTLKPDGANRAGPTLYGVFGRKAGTLPGYPYSKSLLRSNIVWSRKTIKALFSDGPDIITPGSKMPIQRLKNLQHLDALISYLEKVTVSQTDRRGRKAVQ